MKYRAKVTAIEELARATAEEANLKIVQDAKDIWLDCNTRLEADIWLQLNVITELLRDYYKNN